MGSDKKRSLLHFPLHVTVALAVEGAAQCITWNAGIVRAAELSSYANDWGDRLFHAGENVTADLFREAAISFNDTATVLFSQQLAMSVLLQQLPQRQLTPLTALLNFTPPPIRSATGTRRITLSCLPYWMAHETARPPGMLSGGCQGSCTPLSSRSLDSTRL